MYSGFVEELAVDQRTLATQAESKREREGGGSACLCAYYPPADGMRRGGAGGWLCIYINT